MAKDIEQQLRIVVRRSGLSMLQLSKQATIPYASIHRFVSDGGGISLRSAAKLAKLLNLEFRQVRARKGS